MTKPVLSRAPLHQYSVALRITGDDLDPRAVTELLKVEPAQSWKKGEDPRPRSKTAGWEYRLEPVDARFWKSMEDGLNAVLDKLEPRKEAIQRMVATNKVLWWIGHFQTSLDGGPLLSARMLRRLGEFGIALHIDNYFSPGDEWNGDEDGNSTR